MKEFNPYSHSITQYKRIPSLEVKIGEVPIGGNNPIRIQSMTTTDTMDTEGTIAQTIRMVESGCEYVRITAPSLKEAENLRNIREGLHKRGIKVPLIADIHFTPNAAELAARIVEKVRVNPGNYADKKKFETIEYTDASYQAEIERIYKRFSPLVKICKENGTAMRIGTNHGSLSDRIMSRYGDTPHGMVESAFEFIRICEDHNFHQLVISMKSSNTQVMVQAYRLLMQRMIEHGRVYPLHLGVTEAGEGEDGRIKSAVGIGTLLMDGIGDTVRVSLTEAPEFEAPVAKYIVDVCTQPEKFQAAAIPDINKPFYHPFEFHRRETIAYQGIGHSQLPRVVAAPQEPIVSESGLEPFGHIFHPIPDKWSMDEQGADWVFQSGSPIPFMLPNGLKAIYPFSLWKYLKTQEESAPLLTTPEEWTEWASAQSATTPFILMTPDNFQSWLDCPAKGIRVLDPGQQHPLYTWRYWISVLDKQGIQDPVLLKLEVHPSHTGIHNLTEEACHQIYASCMSGALFIDGLADGIWAVPGNALHNRISFGILQASRLRMTRTEYISCPSCGRTLFDLMETTAMIRSRTEHLKGVKIGIMGCIVNGPGEMADADYGYVGSGPGIISLYRGQNMVEKAIKTEFAVDKLIDLIREDGRWVEPLSAI